MKRPAAIACVAAALVVAANVVVAEAPDRSQRPILRPTEVSATLPAELATGPTVRPLLRPTVPDAEPEATSQTAAGASPQGAVILAGAQTVRPRLRPSFPPVAEVQPIASAKPAPTAIAKPEPLPAAASGPAPVSPEVEGARVLAGTTGGVASSQRPQARPKAIGEAITRISAARNKGKLCGVRGIEGSAVGRVRGRQSGCGVKNAVKVRAVSGIALSTPATIDCTTAKALKKWVDTGMSPALGGKGGGVKSITIVGHYACRTRNNLPGAKISEHGKGRAVDIAGFTLRDGSKISVLRDWGRGSNGRALRKMHRAACGPFGTVLGPDANRFHRDHFHFDTARYRSGAYCR